MKNTKRIIKGLLDKVLFNRVFVNNDKNDYPYGGTSVQAVDIDWNDAQVQGLDENGKPMYNEDGTAYFKTITSTGNLLEYIQRGTVTGTNHILFQMASGNDKLSKEIDDVTIKINEKASTTDVAKELSDVYEAITDSGKDLTKDQKDKVNGLINNLLHQYDINGDGVIGPDEDKGAGLQYVLDNIYKKAHNKIKFMVSSENKLNDKTCEIDVPMSAAEIKINKVCGGNVRVAGYTKEGEDDSVKYSAIVRVSNPEYTVEPNSCTYISVIAGTKNITDQYDSINTGLYINNEIMGSSSSYISLVDDEEIEERKWLSISNDKIIFEKDNNLTFKYVDGFIDPMAIRFINKNEKDTDENVTKFIHSQFSFITKDGVTMKDTEGHALIDFDDETLQNNVNSFALKINLPGPGKYDFYTFNASELSNEIISTLIIPNTEPEPPVTPEPTPSPSPSPSPSPTPTPQLFDINLTKSDELIGIADVRVTKTKAKQNEYIRVTVETFGTHKMSDVIIKCDEVELTKTETGYSFRMPESNVNITATLKPAPQPTTSPSGTTPVPTTSTPTTSPADTKDE